MTKLFSGLSVLVASKIWTYTFSLLLLKVVAFAWKVCIWQHQKCFTFLSKCIAVLMVTNSIFSSYTNIVKGYLLKERSDPSFHSLHLIILWSFFWQRLSRHHFPCMLPAKLVDCHNGWIRSHVSQWNISHLVTWVFFHDTSWHEYVGVEHL